MEMHLNDEWFSTLINVKDHALSFAMKKPEYLSIHFKARKFFRDIYMAPWKQTDYHKQWFKLREELSALGVHVAISKGLFGGINKIVFFAGPRPTVRSKKWSPDLKLKEVLAYAD